MYRKLKGWLWLSNIIKNDSILFWYGLINDKVVVNFKTHRNSFCTNCPQMIVLHRLHLFCMFMHTHTHTPVCQASCMLKITWCVMMWMCRFCCLRMNAAEPAVAVALNLSTGKWGAGNKELWGSRRISPRTHTTQQIKGPRGRVWWGNHTGFQRIVVLNLTSSPRPMIEILIRLPVS